jgi:predicted Abi (CAAX) family protease
VISANVNLLKLEHLYHLVGEKDVVEPLGPLLFPGRRRFFPLSYWNRAMRRGKISQLSMGPVGHQVPGGILCPDTVLADGRSSLQQTIDKINAILRGDALLQMQRPPTQPSHYALYQSLPFVRPDYYRLHQSLDPTYYQPIGEWMGRLILPQPEERQRVQGCWFEVYHSPAEHTGLRGQVVMLQFRQDRPQIQKLLAAVTRDVHFDADALYTSEFGGLIHPERVNHWRQVNPLESLAGAHPADDMRVMLSEVAVVASASGPPRLLIDRPPVEITGRFYGLVQFVAPVESDCYQVRHFNRASRRFDGPSEVVSLPPVHLAEAYGSYPSSSQQLETSPCNERGWYIYGAQDQAGRFVVQSLAPRSLFQLQPDRVVFGGAKPSYRYIRQAAWSEVKAQKGQVSSVLCTARDNGSADAISAAVAQWHEGDRALVLHTYGGIGGNKAEPSAAAAPIFFGHFAYGVAQVVRDPLADELRFEINYHQVYTHNSDGLIAGTLHWSRYMGDRQFGWLGTRPTCDLVVKLDCFTGFYDFYGTKLSPLARMETFLAAMMARYRIGDGTGGTYVGPANNCSQDANQALFASIQQQQQQIEDNAELLQRWAADSPEQIARFEQLKAFGHDLKQALQPLGRPRQDWENNEFTLGSTLEDEPLRNLALGLGSWRTLLPRKASDTVVRVFLKYGGSAWVLRTTQVGGMDVDIEPIAPITL